LEVIRTVWTILDQSILDICWLFSLAGKTSKTGRDLSFVLLLIDAENALS
jgi:hypothetical protein